MKLLVVILLFTFPSFSQSDYSHNWNTHHKNLSIEEAFVLKEKISFHGKDFNYKRFYPEQKITEYGNIINGLPNGEWIFVRGEKIILQGTSQRGYKIGMWYVTNNIDEGSYYNYTWNKDSSETVISKSQTCIKKTGKKEQQRVMAR